MSISISVQNQSMKDGIGTRGFSSKGSRGLVEIHQSNVPLELSGLNKKHDDKGRQDEVSRNELANLTLSIPSARGALNSDERKMEASITNATKGNNKKSEKSPKRRQTEGAGGIDIKTLSDNEQTPNRMFDVDMNGGEDTRSQIVITDPQGALRPASHFDTRSTKQRGLKNKSGIVVRKKRVKSVRPGGIRGAALISENYTTQPASTRKSSVGKWNRFVRDHSQANTNAQASTKAGMSSINKQSSVLYKSYAPTGLIQVGNQSVQRLRPRLKSSEGWGHRPTTAGIRAGVGEDPMRISNSQFDSRYSITGATRPLSNFGPTGRSQPMNKFSSMKAAMMNSSSNQVEILGSINYDKNASINTTEPEVRNYASVPTQPNFPDMQAQSDGFKLVSQFENEQAALAYATELQKYYDSLNMDVKVQIEANLDQMDDTEDQRYLAAAQAEATPASEPVETQMADMEIMTEEEQALAKLQIQSSFKGHFKKNEQVKLRPIKGMIKRGDDLTQPNFQKRINKKLQQANPPFEYNKLTRPQIKEIKKGQEQIFGVIKHTAKLPQLSYQNVGAQERHQAAPNFKFDNDIKKTQVKSQANLQARILQKLGVVPAELQGEVPQASETITNDGKIPKSMAKFYQREQKMKKLFDAQVEKWQKEMVNSNEQQMSTMSTEANQDKKFDVDVRLYKERGDDYCIIGNKLQFRACEQNDNPKWNYTHKLAMETKDNFDPLRIRLRIMPMSRAPLAQGKTPDYYFLEAAKKSLSGDLTSAIELLKRGLLINPNHYICRFNHGVLMFKFGLIRNAIKDFERLTKHPHGKKDPWVFYNLATCLIQTGKPNKPLYQQRKEAAIKEQEKEAKRERFAKKLEASFNHRKISILGTAGVQMHSDMNEIFQETLGPKQQPVLTVGFTHAEQVALAVQTFKDTEDNEKGTNNYIRAKDYCQAAVELASQKNHQHDHLIIMDAMNLKGICLFRLGELIESVQVLQKARNLNDIYNAEKEERRRARMKHDDYDEVIGYFTKKDYWNIYIKQKKRSKSFQFTQHKQLGKVRDLKRDCSWGTFEQDEKRIKKELKNAQQEAIETEEDDDKSQKSQYGGNRDSQVVEKINKEVITHLKVEDQDITELRSKAVPTTDNVESHSGESDDKAHITVVTSEHSVAESARSLGDTGSKESNHSKQTTRKTIRFELPDEDTKNKLVSEVVDSKLQHSLVNKLTAIRNKLNHPMDDGRIDILMQKMQEKRQLLAQDRRNLNMSKPQYTLFRKTYLELRKESDAQVDKANPMKRLKNIYLKQFDEFEEEYEDCNILEIAELKKRKVMTNWINEDDLINQIILEAAKKLAKMSEVGVDPVEAELNQKFVEHLLALANVNTEEVNGSHIETLVDICGEQSQMDGIMVDLDLKVMEMCRLFEKELTRGMAELTAIEPKLDEMKILRGERHISVEDENQGHEDIMITRLKDALISDTNTPDEVINVLTTDKFEKEKVKLQLQYMNGDSDDEEYDEDKLFLKRQQIAGNRKSKMKAQQDMRYTERHIEMIRNQFKLLPRDRNYKVLDIMMRHLRFIKTHDRDVRNQIYRNAEFVEYPSQYEIFSMGEEADYMYILIKGRVSCEGTHGTYKDIPKTVSNKRDGESFGELGVVDHHKLDKKGENAKPKHFTRTASCRTVEASTMIRLLASVAQSIIQPSIAKKEDHSTVTLQNTVLASQQMSSLDSFSISGEGIPSTVQGDFETDQLNQKLKFLRSFDMFFDMADKILVPVAVNMTLERFKYGEFLAKANVRPSGMYLIKSGQCIVGLTQVSSRAKNYREIPGSREPIVDKNSLFNRFDPENSLLNNIEIQDRVFQNGRIYVENNAQIRDKIMYHDFAKFSQLFPKKQFGGRCLIPFDIYLQLKRSYFGPAALAKPENENLGDIKKEEQYHMKSFLDVVADSAIVEAYLITKQVIEFLDGQHIKNVYESIVQEKEPDRPYSKEKIIRKTEEMLSSQAESLETVKRIMYENKIEKYGVMAVKDSM